MAKCCVGEIQDTKIRRKQMNVKPEELKKEHDKLLKRKNEFLTKTKRTKIILCVIFALDIISIALIFSIPVVGILLTVIFTVILIYLLIAEIEFRRNFFIRFYHYSPNYRLNSLLKLINEERISHDEIISKANELLIKEKNMYSRGLLRNILINEYIRRNEYEEAFRTNYSDNMLFSVDEYYELIYNETVMEYYFNVNSTTGASEYAERAYKAFNDIYNSVKTKKRDYFIRLEAVKCEKNYAFAHNDTKKESECKKLLDSFSERI